MGDELGGHIVTGHVDTVGEVIGVCAEGDSSRIGVRVDRSLAPAIAQKGSITLDGVSLTVNDVRDAERMRVGTGRGWGSSARAAGRVMVKHVRSLNLPNRLLLAPPLPQTPEPL